MSQVSAATVFTELRDLVGETVLLYAREGKPLRSAMSGREFGNAMQRIRRTKNGRSSDMRLWSLHPKYLDSRGLVALWREGLLAQAVLRGRTSGYRHHPQLQRFRAQPSPLGAIAEYLRGVREEAVTRGYAFAGRKISPARAGGFIAVTRGQLMHEWSNLMTKLEVRDPERRNRLGGVSRPQPHPSFRIVSGDVETWEKRTRVAARQPVQRTAPRRR